MSAYGEFETILCDERFLVEGLTEMGYEVEVNADGSCLRGYHGDVRPERAHVIIRRGQLDGASNDIGFARGTDGRFRAVVSEYDRSIGYNRHWLGKVRERYQECQTRAAVKSKGYTLRDKVIQRKDGFVVFVVCVVASAGIVGGVLYFYPFHVFQSSNAIVTRQVEEPKPAHPPTKPKRVAKAAQRRVSEEAAVAEPSAIPRRITSTGSLQALARPAVPTATPAVQAPAPPVPAADDITLGAQEKSKTETDGDLALSTMTSERGHVLQTFVYARDRGKVTTVIRSEDGKGSSKSGATSAVGTPAPTPRREPELVVNPKPAPQVAASVPPRASASYAGGWSYPTNGKFYGAEPQFVELAIREDNGHLMGGLSVRFKPGQGTDGTPLQFGFGGDWRSASIQTFTIETRNGDKGVIELIPGASPNTLEVNFHARLSDGKSQSGNMILVK